MADTLEIFGIEYTNVAGIIATDDNGNDLTYTRGAHVTQDQDGYIVLPKTGGSGGGSSDFSEATVTFINNTSGVEMYGAFIYEYEGNTPTIMCEAWTDDTDTQRLVLYKGNSVIQLKAQSGEVITVSGDATVDGNYVYVTGDCTITIS